MFDDDEKQSQRKAKIDRTVDDELIKQKLNDFLKQE